MIDNIANYQTWSGNEVRKLLMAVKSEDFYRELELPFESLYNGVKHIILALETCFMIMTGWPIEWDSIFEGIEKMTKDELIIHWEGLDIQLTEEMKSFDKDDTITIPHISKEKFDIPELDYWLQYLTHTVYHRGQIMWTLKKLGYPTKTLDFLFYFLDK